MAALPTCRASLQHVLDLTAGQAHAGLLLSRYLPTTNDNGAGTRNLLEAARRAARLAATLYQKAFERWKQCTASAETRELRVRGRLIIGLGAENVLETGITLHHTYGTPIIPGSALKGLASHYCDRVGGTRDAEYRPEVEETRPDGMTVKRPGRHFRELFGVTEDAGHIVFHDAWILPESLKQANGGLVLDVMTPHHGPYYMADPNDRRNAPTDFDAPNPVPFLSVTGKFRFAVECDVPGEEGRKWAALAMTLLEQALDAWGVGGKTNAGYGRFSK